MNYLLAPIAIYALILLLPYLITFLQLRKIQLQYPEYQLQPAEAVPTYLKDLYRHVIQELANLGFKPCSYLQTTPMTRLGSPHTWELLFYNSAAKTYAIASVRKLAEAADPFQIDFFTYFKDRTLLITMNGRDYGLFEDVPNAIVQDPYAVAVSTQWQAHQKRLQELTASKSPVALRPDNFTQALQSHIRVYLDGLVKGKRLFSPKPGTLRIHWRLLIAILPRQIQGGKKARALAQQRRQQALKNGALQVEIPLEVEVEGFQVMEALNQGLLGQKFRSWMLLLSFGIFLVAYLHVFEPVMLLIFTVALLLHEGGHILAMKLSGYKDTAVLFLPFMGALATAHKDDATLTQKFWVSLAGPLPGLVIGIGLAIANNYIPFSADPEVGGLISQAAWVFIGLNLFNLLPVYPLDGGQIADLLLFSRFPYLGIAFKLLGVILLGLIGLAKPMFLAFTILIALTIPTSFRSAKVQTQLRQELRQNPNRDRTHLILTILRHLKQAGYGKLPFSNRYTLAQSVLNTAHEAYARRTTRLVLIVVYLASLLGGIFGTLEAFAPGFTRTIGYFLSSPEQRLEQVREQQRQRLQELDATLEKNPNDAKAYQRRASLRWALNDRSGAIADCNQVLRLNPENTSIRHLRASLREVEKDFKGAIADYNELIKREPQDVWHYMRRSNAYYQLKDYRQALADANLAIQRDDTDPEAFELRGQIRKEMGDQQGAIADEKKAAELYQKIDQES